MLARGGGAIVNASSGNGYAPATINLDYSAAKAALINLTKALSEEFGARRPRQRRLCPGRRSRRGGPTRAARATSSPRSASTTSTELVVDSGFLEST